jgi:hypothetical protein
MVFFGADVNASDIVNMANIVSIIQKTVNETLKKILKGDDIRSQGQMLERTISDLEKSVRNSKVMSNLLIDSAVMMRQGIKAYNQSLGLMTEPSQKKTQLDNLVVRNYNVVYARFKDWWEKNEKTKSPFPPSLIKSK